MAERLQQFIGADSEQVSRAPAAPPRLLFLSDTLPPLGQYLQERSPFLRGCAVTDVRSQEEATGLSGPAPDLVVLQIAPGRTPCDALVEHAKRHWPQTALLAFSVEAGQDLTSLGERFGVMTTLAAPNLKALHDSIEQEVTQLSFGAIRGVTLPNLLQILHWESRTLAVKVQDAGNWGRLHLRGGDVVDAYEHAGGRTGEEGALILLGLPHPRLSLERSYHNQRRVIRSSLTTLLMEAMKRLDETPAAAAPDTPLLEDAMFFKRWLEPYAAHSADVASPDPPAPGAAGPSPTPHSPEDTTMSNVKDILDSAMGIDGALAAALVDYSSGMALGTAGGGMNLELAAAGNTEVVRAKLRTMESLGIKGQIEDILITLESQYHIIYVMPQLSMFLYLVLSKDRANLAMARFKLKSLAGTISV
ncbi:DUF4388 domain-containing protein [Deinococcus actinosclerus]|uniref:DUF4388 domain-containing protein n=1 Tax=Deinococcus actinosclerus TaxID=1768108 RepID=UPI0009EB8AA8|nr:DUF4388 domain-containing protein [Deinococcus actinosclerus]